MKNIISKISIIALIAVFLVSFGAEAQKTIKPSSPSDKKFEKQEQHPGNGHAPEVELNRTDEVEEPKYEGAEAEEEYEKEDEYELEDESEREDEYRKNDRKRGKKSASASFKGKGKDRGAKFEKELGLSSEQKSEVKSLQSDRKEEMKLLQQDYKKARKELRAAYKSGASDAEIQAKTDKMQSYRERMQMINKEYNTQLKDILTPEQYEKAMETREERSGSMEHRGKGQFKGNRSPK